LFLNEKKKNEKATQTSASVFVPNRKRRGKSRGKKKKKTTEIRRGREHQKR